MDVDAIFATLGSLVGSKYAWIAQVFVVVLFVVTANFLLQRFLKRVRTRLRKTDNPWDDAVIDAARRPASLAFWVLGLTFAADIILRETGAAVFSASSAFRDV